MTDDANDLTLRLDPLTQKLQAFDNTSSVIVAEQSADRTSEVVVTGTDGDDRLSVASILPASVLITFEGGTGSDTLVGKDVDSLWSLTAGDVGAVAGVTFHDVENLVGGAKADHFVFADDASLSGLIDGGAGSDRIVGPDTASTWIIDGPDAGQLGGGRFTGVESLASGAGDDTFVFEASGSLSGVIEGNGANALDYSKFGVAVTVDLGLGTATGTGGVSGVRNVTGGPGDDVLIGDAGDNVFRGGLGVDSLFGGAGLDTLLADVTETLWHVTGPNLGTLDGQTFVDFENLVGAADNEDSFVFDAVGRISGFIAGGDAGHDSLTLSGEYFALVTYTSTGFASGTVERDGDVITYFGLEPITDPSGGAKVFTNATDGADVITVRDVWAAADDRFAVHIGTAGQEDLVFTNASGITSLTVNSRRGDDTIVLEALDSFFNGDLTLDAGPGDDDIHINAITGRGAYTVRGGSDPGDVLRFSSSDRITLSDAALLNLRFNESDVNVTRRVFLQAETAIAVDPTDPDHIVIGPNDASSLTRSSLTGLTNDSVWVTEDGGRSWTREEIPLPPGPSVGHGDPTVVFDRTGQAIYAHLTDTGLAAAVKPRKGDPWTPVPIATEHIDKPWLAVGPRFGALTQERVVVAYHVSNQIFLLASDDGGITWNALGGTPTTPTPKLVSTSPLDPETGRATAWNPIPAVGPNGEIYVVWEDFRTVGESILKFRASLDGGMTWGPEHDIYKGNVNRFLDPSTEFPFPVGYSLPAQGPRPMHMGVSIDVDRSGGPHHGRIYVAFADQADQDGQVDTGTPDHDDLDVFVLVSDDFKAGSQVPDEDKGKPGNWAAHGGTDDQGSLRVGHGPGVASQFLPWLDVDPSSGNVALVWYDARNDSAGKDDTPNTEVEYFASISIDGGQTWSANVPVSDGVSFGEEGGSFFEYNSAVFLDGRLYMPWADNSNVTGDNPDSSPILMDVYYDRAVVDAVRLDGIDQVVLSVADASLVHAGDFTGQLIFTSGVPDWVNQGPGPLRGGQVVNIEDGAVAGATQAIAVDPRDLLKVYVGTVGGGLWANSDRSVFFETRESELDDSRDKPLLDELAELLRRNAALTVEIHGHADSVGTPEDNRDLSEARANSVRDYLVVDKGIDPSRLMVEFFGETRPIVPNNPGDQGTQENRRVELIVDHWEPLTDFFPSLSIASLAIDPSNPDTIYAGTGSVSSATTLSRREDTAIGILKSTDAGKTWKILTGTPFQSHTIRAIEVTTGGAVLVATDGGRSRGAGLFLSSGGGPFTAVSTSTGGAFPAVPVTDIAVDPADPNRFYAGVPGRGVFTSTDSGASWNLVNTNLVGFEAGSRIMLATGETAETGKDRPVYAAIIQRVVDVTTSMITGQTDTFEVAAGSLLRPGDRVVITDATNPDEIATIAAIEPVGTAGVALEVTLRSDLQFDRAAGATVSSSPLLDLGSTAAAIEATDTGFEVEAGTGLQLGDRVVISDGVTPNEIRPLIQISGAVDGKQQVTLGGAPLQFDRAEGAKIQVPSRRRLSGVFRSDDLGASWTDLGLPGTTEITGFVGIHPSGQGRLHFSMAADPYRADAVYVGGDRQATPFPNSIGASDATGRLFRWENGTGWEAITNDGATGGGGPHADSRDMAFQGLHLLEADDGGIYRLTNPGQAARIWESLNGDLSLTEFYDVAYQTVDDLILGGTQDVGTGLQSATGSKTWDALLPADGAQVAVDGTRLYYSAQSFRAFGFAEPLLFAVPGGTRTLEVAAGSRIQQGDKVFLPQESDAQNQVILRDVAAVRTLSDGSREIELASDLIGDYGEGTPVLVALQASGGLEVRGSGGADIFDVEGSRTELRTIQSTQPFTLNSLDPTVQQLLGSQGVTADTVGSVFNVAAQGGAFVAELVVHNDATSVEPLEVTIWDSSDGVQFTSWIEFEVTASGTQIVKATRPPRGMLRTDVDPGDGGGWQVRVTLTQNPVFGEGDATVRKLFDSGEIRGNRVNDKIRGPVVAVGGFVAELVATQNSGQSNLEVTIQDSPDGVTWTDWVSFSPQLAQGTASVTEELRPLRAPNALLRTNVDLTGTANWDLQVKLTENHGQGAPTARQLLDSQGVTANSVGSVFTLAALGAFTAELDATENSGTASLDVTIQDSTDGVTWTDWITFAQLTDTGTGFASATRPPKALLRTNADLTGTGDWDVRVTLTESTRNNLLIGTRFLYESTDNGRNLTLLNGSPTSSGAIRVPRSANVGEVNALVYGGRQPDPSGGFVEHADVIWVGSDPTPRPIEGNAASVPPREHGLWVRLAGAGFFSPVMPVTSFTDEACSTEVRDVAVDPDDWRKVYVLDADGRIWFSDTSGPDPADPGSWSWTRLDLGQTGPMATNDLSSLSGAKNLQRLEVQRVGGERILLVAGEGGVFRRIAMGAWAEYGAGLPNSLVTAVEGVGGDDDLLLAGTLGRGAWTLPEASHSLAVHSTLELRGTSGHDVFELERNADEPWLLDVYQYKGTSRPATPSASVPFASLESISIDGMGSTGTADRFVVHVTNGAIDVPGGISVAGRGSGGIEISNSGTLTVSEEEFTDAASGSHRVTMVDSLGESGTQVVNWTGMTTRSENVSVSANVDVVRAGLEELADFFRDFLFETLCVEDLASLNPLSLARALNGLLVSTLRDVDAPFVDFAQVVSGGEVQLDGASSALLRLFEEAGLDLAELATTGAISTPPLLEMALEGLDQSDDNVASPIVTSDSIVFENVNVEDIELRGIVDLDAAARVLGGEGALELRGLLEVVASVDLHLGFGVDSEGFFVTSNSADQPLFVIDDLRVGGDVSGTGRLGFLGVDITGGKLTLDEDVGIEFALADASAKLRLSDLATSNVANLVSASVQGDDEGDDDDVVLRGNFEVSALLPGVPSGISLGAVELEIAWPDLSKPDEIADPTGISGPFNDVLKFLETTTEGAITVLQGFETGLQFLTEHESLLGIDVSAVQDVVDDILGFAESFQQEILDPVSDVAAGNFTIPTIQQLVVDLANALGIDPTALGLAYTGDELTFDIDFTHVFPTITEKLDFGVDFEPIGDLSLDGEAEFAADVTVDLTVGLDLGDLAGSKNAMPPVPLAERFEQAFFLRDASISANANFSSTGLTASARLGFIEVDVAPYGNDPLTSRIESTSPLSFTVRLADPGPTDDGKITLSELQSAISSPLSLLETPEITGSVQAQLPLGVSIPGLSISPSAETTAVVTLAKIDDFDSLTVQFPDFPDMKELLNFNNLSAAEFVSQIAVLAAQLDNLRKSDLIENLDIPFIEGAIDEILGFAEMLSDGVLFDEGDDDERDGPDRLITDLNAALADAGLADRFLVTGNGTGITLQAIDSKIASFQLAGVAPGFGDLGLGTDPVISGTPRELSGTPASPNLSDDATFTILINGNTASEETIEVTLLKGDTDDNTGIGDDTAKLVRADNSATFTTVQQLTDRLNQLLGVQGLVAYEPTSEVLSVNLGTLLPQPSFETDLPIDFDLADLGIDLSPLLDIESDTTVHLKANLGLDLILGVYLGETVPGAAGDLSLNPTTLSELNDGEGVDIRTTPGLTGPGDVAKALGELSGDASFGILLDGGITGTSGGGESSKVKIHDLNADFLAAANPVQVGDLVKNLGTGEIARVTAVAEKQLETTELAQSWLNAQYQVAPAVTVSKVLGKLAGNVNVTGRNPEPFGRGPQAEVSIAVNPANEKNIIVAPIDRNPTDGENATTRQNSVWVSDDGGENWDRKRIPNPVGVAASGDPSIVFSRDGKLAVYVHLVRKETNTTERGVGFAVSKDGGMTWDENDAGMIGLSGRMPLPILDDDLDGFDDDHDKPFVAVGPQVGDLTKDRFAIAWVENKVLLVSTSTDGTDWSAPVIVGNLTGGKGEPYSPPKGEAVNPHPAFGPKGELYVVWEDAATPGVSRIMFDASFDGGKTWGSGNDSQDITDAAPNKVFWHDAGEYEIPDLLKNDRDKLDAFAKLMRDDLQLVATVMGFTDTQGDPAANQTLSDDRANAVVEYLKSKGVAEDRLTKLGFGETRLAFPTGPDEDQLLNRRVELNIDRVIYTGNVNAFEDRGRIDAVTGTNPLTIRTKDPHGLTTGQVRIDHVEGLTQINGQTFNINRIDATHFSLPGWSGQGSWTGGGTWSLTGGVAGITGLADPTKDVIVTSTNPHGLQGFEAVEFSGINPGSTPAHPLNGARFEIDVLTPTTFELVGLTTLTGVPAWSSGGTWEVAGQYTIAAQPARGVLMGVSIGVDQTNNEETGGRVYVAFNDQTDNDKDNDWSNRAQHDDLDVFVIHSSDDGKTWNAKNPVRVHDANTNSQYMPWLDVDPSTGYVAVAWYDARNDSGPLIQEPNDDVQFFASYSIDGGLKFLDDIQVSKGTSNAGEADPVNNFLEYNGLDFFDNTIHLAWADNSDSTFDNPGPGSAPDIYYDRISLSTTTLQNTKMSDLLDDVNAAIAARPALAEKFMAFADGDRLGIRATDTNLDFELVALKNDPAVRELGFRESQKAGGPLRGSAIDRGSLFVGNESQLLGAAFRLVEADGMLHDVPLDFGLTGTPTMLQLVDAVNTALSTHLMGTPLSGKVTAAASGDALELRLADSMVPELELGFVADLDNPVVLALGLPDQGTISLPHVQGAKNVPVTVGRLSSDQTFKVSVDQGMDVSVTIAAADTESNTSILNLVSNVNQALRSTSLAGRIVADSVGNKLVLGARDSHVLSGSAVSVFELTSDPESEAETSFTLSITNAEGTSDEVITLAHKKTVGNTTIADHDHRGSRRGSGYRA
jgi:outer membrane protein OmpA-like peptidoglycan-associated protein